MKSTSLGMITLALWACGVEPTDAAPLSRASAARPAPIEVLGETVADLGLNADLLLREAGVLGEEQGWTVVAVPAFPGPNEPFRLIAVADDARTPPDGVFLLATTTAWASSVDVPGRRMTAAGGRPMYMWGPVSLPAPTTVELAVRVEEPNYDVWLSDGGNNYRVLVDAPVSLTWVGDVVAVEEGLTRNLPADPLHVAHDLTVYASTYPQGADAQVAVRWSRNGVPQPEVIASIGDIGAGQFGNDTRWEARLPTAAWSPGDQLRFSVVARSASPELVDNAGGGGFLGTYGAPPPVAWWDSGMWNFNMCHWDGMACFTGWRWTTSLQSPLDATPGAFQARAAAPIVGVDVFVPGVTDRLDYDPAGLDWLRVEVSSPFFSGDPLGAWASHPMTWVERSGDNLRFEWEIRDAQHPTMPPFGVDCPADGVYPYQMRISTDAGRTWMVVGPADFPNGNVDGEIIWSNFLAAPDLTAMPGDRVVLPSTPVGAPQTGSITLVNTGNTTVQVRDLRWTGGGGVFGGGWPGCPDLTACSFDLAPGAQREIFVRYTPMAAGPVVGTLELTRDAAGCVSERTSVYTFEGEGR